MKTGLILPQTKKFKIWIPISPQVAVKNITTRLQRLHIGENTGTISIVCGLGKTQFFFASNQKELDQS